MCEYDTCGECVARKTCGWCASSSSCFEGDLGGPFVRNCSFWNFELCEAGCAELDTCDACILQDGCGFCTSSCSCLQGHKKGPAFGRRCEDWVHLGSSTSKTCVAPQKWPGHWASSTKLSTKICASKQYRRLAIERLAPAVDRANALQFAEKMEENGGEGAI